MPCQNWADKLSPVQRFESCSKKNPQRTTSEIKLELNETVIRMAGLKDWHPFQKKMLLTIGRLRFTAHSGLYHGFLYHNLN